MNCLADLNQLLVKQSYSIGIYLKIAYEEKLLYPQQDLDQLQASSAGLRAGKCVFLLQLPWINQCQRAVLLLLYPAKPRRTDLMQRVPCSAASPASTDQNRRAQFSRIKDPNFPAQNAGQVETIALYLLMV